MCFRSTLFFLVALCLIRLQKRNNSLYYENKIYMVSKFNDHSFHSMFHSIEQFELDFLKSSLDLQFGYLKEVIS